MICHFCFINCLFVVLFCPDFNMGRIKASSLLSAGLLWLLIDLGEVTFRNNVAEGVDLMFHLYAGREDCFYEHIMDQNKTIYVEFNVIGTGVGDNDVNFMLMDPQRRPLVSEYRKPNSRHEYDQI